MSWFKLICNWWYPYKLYIPLFPYLSSKIVCGYARSVKLPAIYYEVGSSK